MRYDFQRSVKMHIKMDLESKKQRGISGQALHWMLQFWPVSDAYLLSAHTPIYRS